MNEFLKGILDGINVLFGNYGWSIIVFTVLIRVVLFPFDYKSRVSMRKTTKIQPQMAALQKKYANDKEKLNKKMAELYKKEHINPLSGCLPVLLTMPILFAMFAAMRMIANEALVQQAFDILQGKQPAIEGWLWVKNLWMPDSPFTAVWPDLNSLRAIPSDIWTTMYAKLGDTAASLPALVGGVAYDFSTANLSATITAIYNTMETLPGYAQAVATMPGWSFNLLITTLNVVENYNGFFILPILAAVTQYLMTVLQPTQAPAEGQQQAGTGAFMKWFFPIFSLFICSSYNAGFSLYWVTSNVIAAIQTFAINWYLDQKDKKAEVVGEGNIK